MPALQSVGMMQLEDACDETPQAEQLLELCRQDVEEVRTFGTMFHGSCSKTAEGFTAMVSGLTEMLEVCKQIHTRYSREDEANVSFLQAQNGLQTMIVYLGEVCGIMHNMSNELSNNMMYPIDRFMRADLEALEHRSAVHCASSEQYKETLDKYARLPKRKTDARTRTERYDEVRLARAQAREDTLQYFAALHSLNLKRSYLFLEPLLGYLRAFVAATRSSAEVLSKRDVETNLTVFDAFVKSEHRDLTANQRRLETQIETLRNELRSEAFTSGEEAEPKKPEEAEEDKKEPQDTAPESGRPLRSQPSLQKSGYLFVKRVQNENAARSGVASFLGGSGRQTLSGTWERAFVFIQGGNLMVQARQELAGSSLIDLQDNNALVCAEPLEHDDRLGVFAVFCTALASEGNKAKGDKKLVAYFQTESDLEREEWIRLVNLNSGFSGDTPRALPIARSASSVPNDSPSHARAANVLQQMSVDVSLLRVHDSPLDLDTALEFVPIQFDLSDLPTPAEHSQSLVDAILNALASPSYVRTNPFNADAGSAPQSLADEIAAAEAPEECADGGPRLLRRFLVRFVGSMQVGGAAHAGVARDELVSAAIRKMLHARSTHDLMRMLELSLVLCEHCVALLDGANRQGVRSLIDLQRVVQLVCDRDNPRYFGLLVRKADSAEAQQSEQLECFAFECDAGGADVYEAFKLASRVAFQVSLAAANRTDKSDTS